ncbi:MAG: flavin-dependent oxidoreductase [Variovorax sp.]|nr:MAG: flavin-dependent oxidoreductase [Variovorax sp.]
MSEAAPQSARLDSRRKVIIIGGGISGLTLALMLNRRGLACEIFEQAESSSELGVGMNLLPQAVGELAGLGLLCQLDAVAIRTHALIYLSRRGQEVWRELRGREAGNDVPQFSIHRGHLHRVLRNAVERELGAHAVRYGHRLAAFRHRGELVHADLVNRSGERIGTAAGNVVVGADGIHSTVRAALYPREGPPCWNGAMIWRGCVDWPEFLDGRSMIVAGGLNSKAVVYPIGPALACGTRLTNWAIVSRVAPNGSVPPQRQDWSRPGDRAELAHHLERFAPGHVDISRLVEATPEFWEYPMCDRDPLPGWSIDRVTLLGDAAHPMYPVGSNGATQAIVDARCLADCLAASVDVRRAFAAYERERLPPTTRLVLANRKGGPEAVIDAVEARAPDGFSNIEAVLPFVEREAIVRGALRGAARDSNHVQLTERRNHDHPHSPPAPGHCREAGKGLSRVP